MSEHELWNELGKIYFNTGAFDAAINAYSKAIELNPEFGIPYSNLALAYVQKGKYPEALTFYRRSIGLLQNNKARAIAWNRLGDMYRQLKDYDNAVAAFRRADELDMDLIMYEEVHEPVETNPYSEGSTVIRNDQKPVYKLASEPQAAPGFLSGSIPDGQPRPAEPAINIEGEASLQIANATPDITGYDMVEEDIEAGPEAQDIYLDPALFTVNSEESEWLPLEDAEKYSQNEGSPLDEFTGGGISQALPQMDAAEDPETPAVEMPAAQIPDLPDTRPLVPTDLPVYSDPEQEMRLAGIFPEDIPAPDPAVTMEDGSTPLSVAETSSSDVTQEPHSNQLTLAPDELAELNRDIMNMKRVLEINPKNAFGWDSLGRLYKSAGQYDEAIAAYERARELDPSKSFYCYNLGLVYAAKKEFEKAIQIFQNVLELNPDYNLAHATIAGCYRRLGREEEAQKHIQIAAISIQDENEYNLACFEAICGNVDHSMELLRASLARNQVSLEWVRRDPDLDFVREDPRYAELVGSR